MVGQGLGFSISQVCGDAKRVGRWEGERENEGLR